VPRDRRKRSNRLWGWPEVAIAVLLSLTLLGALVVLAVLYFVSNINWDGWNF
jgi:hypothetical protein